MTSQTLAVVVIALTFAMVTPAEATAQPVQEESHAAEAAAEPIVEQPQLMPISYSLTSDTNNAPPAPSRGSTLSSANAAAMRHRALQAEALRWEIAYLALSAIDAAQAVDCIGRGECTERNPLFGKRPSAGKIILGKAIGSALHFLAFSHLNKRNPKLALRGAQITAGLQGAVLVLNARYAF